MCLITSQKRGKVALKPIKVYKKLNKMQDGKYVTPSIDAPVSDEVIAGKKPFVAEGKLEKVTTTSITRGVIHCYKRRPSCGDNVFECEIPVGATYWVGNDGDIAASRIVIKEKLEPLPSDNCENTTWEDSYITFIKKAAELGEVTDENKQDIYNYWYGISEAFPDGAKPLNHEMTGLVYSFQNAALYVKSNPPTPITFDLILGSSNLGKGYILFENYILGITQQVYGVTNKALESKDFEKMYAIFYDTANTYFHSGVNFGYIDKDKLLFETVVGLMTSFPKDDYIQRTLDEYNKIINTLQILGCDRDRLKEKYNKESEE